MKKFIGTLIILITVSCLTIVDSGCKKKEPAPTMPSSSTMAFYNANFSDTTGMSTNKATYANFFHSAVNIGFWNLLLTITLAVPVTSYAIAVNQEAEYDKHDKTWTWDYDFNSWGHHNAVLTAKLDGDTVIWKMKIDNFDWYYGHSNTNGSGGYWMLNESPSQPTNLLRIDWQLNSTGVSSIKYTNVAPSNSANHYKNNGEYIQYGTVAGSEFDRFYNIFMKDDNTTTITNLTEIAWNFADKHGHVKDPKKFTDTNWHCWNSAAEDIVCP